jgi:hypothetical protein
MWIAEVCPTAAPKRPQREAYKLPSKQFGVACSGLETERSNGKVLLDEAMEIGEAYKRFDRVLRQFQRMGYGNRDILLDATGGGMPLRVGAALAAMMRKAKIVHQRVRGDR